MRSSLVSRARLVLVLGAIALTSPSCDDANDPDPIAAVVGTFELARVNSSILPALSIDGSRTFTSGSIEFKSDGTFAEVVNYRTTDPQHPITGFAGRGGTWTISGDEITTTLSVNGQQRTATFANNEVTFGASFLGPDTYVFSR